jgi:hypothetical protein
LITLIKGAWDSEEHSDSLFEKHTIAEIRQLEQTTRKDVGEKREELRQMVGERYRDLISAADTIVEIKNTANTVSCIVGRLKEDLLQVQQVHHLKGFAGSSVSLEGPSSKSFVLTAQLKLFVDLPTKLWSCVETKSCLKAAQYHLLAQHIAHKLNLESGQREGARLLRTFPVFANHWSSLSNIQSSILSTCRESLRHASLSEQAQAECLSAILLLEGSSLRQVFNEFLLARKMAIQSIIHSQDHTVSVKAQVVDVAKSLRLSLSLISSIFCLRGDDSSLVCRILQTIIGQANPADGNFTDGTFYEPLLNEFTSRTHYKHLPDDVREFRPSLSVDLKEIPSDTIHSLCREWINNVRKEVQEGVGKLLQHVGTIKSIGAIVASVHSLLTEPLAQGINSQAEWESVCAHVIGQPLSIWGEFLQPVVQKRCQVIIDRHVTSAENKALLDLGDVSDSTQTLDRGDVKFVNSLFEEDSCDFITTSTIALSNHPTAWKVRSFTPTVLKFCSRVNKELEEGIVADVKHILRPPKSKFHHFSARHIGDKNHKEGFPFDLFSMDQDIRSHLSTATTNLVTKIVAKVDDCLKALKTSAEGKSELESYKLIERILVLGRICKGLKDCCPALHGLVQGLYSSAEGERKKFRLPSSSSENKSTPSLSDVQENVHAMLWQRYLDAHKIWCAWIKEVVLDQFNLSLTGQSPSATLATPLLWEDIVITEENESGQAVESKIRVPSQVSPYVLWLLYALSREVVCAGGHTLPSSFLRHLSFSLLESVLALYDNLLQELKDKKEILTQNCAVQHWFDVKVLSSVLLLQEKQGTTRNSLHETSTRILQQLESSIDPFDLNVYLPYLNYFVDRQKQRCSVLLGPLVHASSLSSSHSLSRSKPPNLPQERHQVIPLGPQVGRFTMLPIGTGSMLKRSNTSVNKLLTEDVASLPDVLDVYRSSLDLFH